MPKITKYISVMLVDDDADDRKIFSKALSQVAEKASLTSFSNGKELIDFLNKEKHQESLPDILFLDINMPVMNGIDVLHKLRTDLKISNLPIAIYSTSSHENDILNALKEGANIYITKPRSFDKLTEVIQKVLLSDFQDNSKLTLNTFVL